MLHQGTRPVRLGCSAFTARSPADDARRALAVYEPRFGLGRVGGKLKRPHRGGVAPSRPRRAARDHDRRGVVSAWTALPITFASGPLPATTRCWALARRTTSSRPPPPSGARLLVHVSAGGSRRSTCASRRRRRRVARLARPRRREPGSGSSRSSEAPRPGPRWNLPEQRRRGSSTTAQRRRSWTSAAPRDGLTPRPRIGATRKLDWVRRLLVRPEGGSQERWIQAASPTAAPPPRSGPACWTAPAPLDISRRSASSMRRPTQTSTPSGALRDSAATVAGIVQVEGTQRA
jgi:hypothetical protein